MKNLYLVEIKLFNMSEETSSSMKRPVVASNEDETRSLVGNMLDKMIKEMQVPMGYEIGNIEFVREM